MEKHHAPGELNLLGDFKFTLTMNTATLLKRSLVILIVVLILTGCSQFDSIPYNPQQTPETWLRIQPFIELRMASRTIIIIQPTTTAIVYLLGIVTIGVGLYFLGIRDAQRSRLWWGIALLLWGIGALFAGTSYEAFSYQIKCAGRAVCIWTSWWEIAYLVASVASVDAMLMAQAHSCATGNWRRFLTLYALGNFVLYLIAVLIGILIPIQFLMSFELLLLFSAPTIVLFIVQNGWRYHSFKRGMDLALLGTWIWLVLTIGGYFLYLISGLTQLLWSRGIWFSENDVLHLGLLIWMVYIAVIVARRVEDESFSCNVPSVDGMN